jgi:adenine-specific DNA-methyltransferase
MRYIGSKSILLHEIENAIKTSPTSGESFCDLFCGSTAVARHFKRDFKIISNDILYFSYVLQKATIENSKRPSFERLKSYIKQEPIYYLNHADVEIESLKQKPFIYENYSPNTLSNRKYFTNENALRIDFIRQTIDEWRESSMIDDKEFYYLLASLIEAVPYISNIAGTYSSYLKEWDSRALQKLQLKEIDIINNGKKNIAFNQNAKTLLQEIEGDILYMDPPYTNRQYISYYHLLETISLYDNPNISSKSGIRQDPDKKSKLSLKNHALQEFRELIECAEFRYIIVSYSSDGIMDIDKIKNILTSVGDRESLKIREIPYKRFAHKSTKTKESVTEYLFCISLSH